MMKKILAVLCAAALLLSFQIQVFAGLKPEKTIVAKSGTPTIDGIVDANEAWKNVDFQKIPDSPDTGLGGDFKVLWDASSLYVLAVVNDTTPSEAVGNHWGVDIILDSIEVYFSPSNFKDKENNYAQPGDGHVCLSVNNAIAGNTPAKAEAFKAVRNGNTTTYEAKIKLEGITPAEGTIIGFNITINNESDGDGTTREEYVSWRRDGTFWADTQYLNEVKFESTPVEAAPVEITSVETTATNPDTGDESTILFAALMALSCIVLITLRFRSVSVVK